MTSLLPTFWTDEQAGMRWSLTDCHHPYENPPPNCPEPETTLIQCGQSSITAASIKNHSLLIMTYFRAFFFFFERVSRCNPRLCLNLMSSYLILDGRCASVVSHSVHFQISTNLFPQSAFSNSYKWMWLFFVFTLLFEVKKKDKPAKMMH